MTEKTIKFNVPVETLKDADFYHSADHYKKRADSALDSMGELIELALVALVEAQDDLTSNNGLVPVSKDTKWGQVIESPIHTNLARFIAPLIDEDDCFVFVDEDGEIKAGRYDRWFEVVPSKDPKPEIGEMKSLLRTNQSLMTKVQYLIDFMPGDLLPHGSFTFPDGETWWRSGIDCQHWS